MVKNLIFVQDLNNEITSYEVNVSGTSCYLDPLLNDALSNRGKIYYLCLSDSGLDFLRVGFNYNILNVEIARLAINLNRKDVLKIYSLFTLPKCCTISVSQTQKPNRSISYLQ